MASIDDSLISGESVMYRGRLHWVVLLGPLAMAALFLAAGVAMIYFGETQKQNNLQWLTEAGIAPIVIAAIFLIRGLWRRRAVEIGVTNRRVILSRGVVDRKTEEILLQKIESIGVDQSVWGRMLGYGTVRVRGTGGTYEPFLHVAHPVELRRHVQEQIAAATGAAAS